MRNEAPSHQQYDAVFVPSYWISKHPNGERGSLRHRLGTRAGVRIIENQGNAGKLVFLAGNLRGPNIPTSAALAKDEAINKYGIDEARIVAEPLAYGTEEETLELKRLANEHGWKNVAAVGFKTHFKSIGRFLPEGEHDGLTVAHLKVEVVLKEFDNKKVARLAERLTKSPRELAFWLYEFAKDTAFRIPGMKDKLYSLNKKERIAKDGLANNLIARLLDVFKS